jgi:Mn2+/Fe2+ NRAMP family transporter
MKGRVRWQALGPGLLYAGAAVGVSHVVQSTRAGALYGFALLLFVLFVNAVKYPFFEFASRYTAHTGEHLLQAYRKQGKWVLPLFLLMSALTMFPILAAISAVFSGIMGQVTVQLGFEKVLNPVFMSALALALCVLILIPGRYNWLDRTMKAIMLLLSTTTLLAVVVALCNVDSVIRSAAGQFSWDRPGWLFLIAFAGWMPTPIDASAWQSLWIHAKQQNQRLTPAELSFDFKLGYFATTLLAVLFLMLGALVLYPGATELPVGGAAFAGWFMQLYAQLLGGWAWPIVAVSVLTTMFSTLLTVLDAYPRVLVAGFVQYRSFPEPKQSKRLYWWLVLLLAFGALIVLQFFGSNMLALVDFSTTMSFLAAPLLAWWNLQLLKTLPSAAQPSLFMLWWARLGVGLLLGFALVFLWVS